ncbi:MAG: cytoplasmic protein [Verrucomicrobia bacterium]|jgi:Pyrimidine dimer DNA glycosylase|nr:cytoplasmic protein [Verrucomicrobiota bacterium]
MQTFLPCADFRETASVLDYRRLGKQRVEAFQIFRALNGETKGWRNHPAVLMWNGYETALALYAIAICDEWIARGYKDTMKPRFQKILEDLAALQEQTTYPSWLGDAAFHESHQSNLIRKFPEHYQHLWPDVPNNLEYVWPEPKSIVDKFVLVV